MREVQTGRSKCGIRESRDPSDEEIPKVSFGGWASGAPYVSCVDGLTLCRSPMSADLAS
ncbi:MAG: hypothetical protein LBF49_01530 [Puniceicoccales bacterium]|jgi:hypothetical protein|nr:hypothetical protein [Puniceicoccales bacterium]